MDIESLQSPLRSKHDSTDLAGSVFLITSDGRTLDLPIPSRSHRDPLNWTRRKRAGAFFSLIFFSITALMLVQFPNLMYTPLAQEFAGQILRPFCLDTVLLAQTLFMGIGAFVWIPLSLAIGRRGVLLCSNLLLLGAVIWAGFSGSFYQLLVAVSLQGLSEGVCMSAVLLMIIDLTFIHQRPQAIAMYWATVGCFNFIITSLVPQMTNAGTNWRLFYELWAIPVFISGILIFFLFPETYFQRPAVAFDGRILLQSATEKIRVYPDWESSPIQKELPDTPQAKWKLRTRELKFWSQIDGGWRSCRHCYIQILFCLIHPLLFWVMVLKCLMFTGLMSGARTYASVLSAPPYNMKIQHIGLINIGGAIGCMLAWPASSLLITTITRRLTIRNNGVRKSEYYLPAIIMPVLVLTSSFILYGLTAHFKLHFILVCLTHLMSVFGLTSLETSLAIWVTEAFPRNAAAALAVTNGCSYAASFGLSYAIKPWIQSQGLAGADLELALLMFLVGCVGVPIAFWGKKVRQTIEGRWAKHEGGALRPQSETRV